MGLPTNAHILLVVVFLHFMCAGLIIPLLPRYLVMNGASQVVTATLHTAAYICQELCKDFVALFEVTKKRTIMLSNFLCFIYYFTLVFYSDLWVVCCTRCLYALTVRVVYLTKEYIKLNEPEQIHAKFLNLVHGSRVVGIALGSVMGGYIFESSGDFESNAMVASALTLVSVVILQLLDDDINTIPPKSELTLLPSKCCKYLKILKNVRFGFYWEDVFIKVAYISTFAVYYSRFAFLITCNYNVGNIFLGYALAYDHILLYMCNCFAPFIVAAAEDKELLVEYSLIVCGVLLCGLFYAPTKICFLILLAPTICLYVLINALFKDDVFELKTTENINEAAETLSVLSNIFTPILFGFVCEYLGVSAFKILALVPIAFCVYILNERFMEVYDEEDEDEYLSRTETFDDDEEEQQVIETTKQE